MQSALLAVVALLVLLALALALAALAARLRAAPRAGPRAALRGGAEPRRVRWAAPPGPCFPRALVAECLDYVRKMPGYAPVGAAEMPALEAEAARLSRRHGVRLPAAALVSLRHMEASLAAGRAAGRARAAARAIAAASAAGEPVLAIAARLRLPPAAVLRALAGPGGRLPARLGAEAAAALEADIGSPAAQARVRAAAQAYEDAVGARLRALGLEFETEAGLRAGEAPGGAPGKAPLTPDFLFRGPVEIDGRPVAWLDAKDYPAVDSPLVMKGLRRQAEKYTARFGPGAFAFSGGVMCDSRTARLGALVLDGSGLA